MKAKGRPTKRYKSSVEDNQNISSSAVAKSNEGFLKTCSYCLGRGHNIRGTVYKLLALELYLLYCIIA
ncbi:hypothetical protein RhiirA5_414218 [Rhizophagus irregularis]|uniref:Uncharacterized protein n=1 Tax=Rhizophagus irregularis TaxID=588596 RepID=A0A2N0PUS2_9GLOM|nr:hypothetical protein RhiirA5_414218 [Rhizophagus irregularis]